MKCNVVYIEERMCKCSLKVTSLSSFSCKASSVDQVVCVCVCVCVDSSVIIKQRDTEGRPIP